MKLHAAVSYTSVTLTVAVLTALFAYTYTPNNPISWHILFCIWAFTIWNFFNSFKSYKWGLQLYNLFFPSKMVVELTDFHGNKQFTIVSPCNTQNTEWAWTKLAWEGFIFPTTKACPLYLCSNGSVFHPNWVAYWQPVKQNLRTEHFLRNSETIVKLQSTIKRQRRRPLV